ncbi:MAG: hypothetical protein ACRDGI_04155, partial [Candidatus Limnocylindrales bacterium]
VELGVTPPSSRIPGLGCQVVALSGWEAWMRGPLVYADTFWVLDCVGVRGDRLARARAGMANGTAGGSISDAAPALLDRRVPRGPGK